MAERELNDVFRFGAYCYFSNTTWVVFVLIYGLFVAVASVLLSVSLWMARRKKRNGEGGLK